MAKRKRAALFEVFSDQQRTAEKPPWTSRVGQWWSARREARRQAAASRAIVSRSIPEPVDTVPVSRPKRNARLVDVRFDSDNQVVNLRLSYASAIITAACVVLVVTVAYVLGRQTRGPMPVLAERSTEDVRDQAPQPYVLDVSTAPTIEIPMSAGVTTTPAPNGRTPTWNDPRPPPTLVVDDQKRTVGLNYVIIQSYPDIKDAEAARDVLLKNNILCTVEPAPSNWVAPGVKMYSVIGIKGFDKIRNSPEYDRYIAQIRQVSDEFAGRSRFRRFDPAPYKWRDAH